MWKRRTENPYDPPVLDTSKPVRLVDFLADRTPAHASHRSEAEKAQDLRAAGDAAAEEVLREPNGVITQVFKPIRAEIARALVHSNSPLRIATGIVSLGVVYYLAVEIDQISQATNMLVYGQRF